MLRDAGLPLALFRIAGARRVAPDAAALRWRMLRRAPKRGGANSGFTCVGRRVSRPSRTQTARRTRGGPFLAAPWQRSPSVVIALGEAVILSAFLMQLSAAALSLLGDEGLQHLAFVVDRAPEVVLHPLMRT